MTNRELVRRAEASLDVLRGYLKAVNAEELAPADVAALEKLTELAAEVPVAETLRGKPRPLTEG